MAIIKGNPIKAARRQAEARQPTTEPGMCLRETRECYGIGPMWPDAITAWQRARRKHPSPALSEIPKGVPVFWSGGSEGHGHVAIAAEKDGYCWSVDILRSGYWDRVLISKITTDWGLTFLGWTEDLNGTTVWTPTVRRTGIRMLIPRLPARKGSRVRDRL